MERTLFHDIDTSHPTADGWLIVCVCGHACPGGHHYGAVKAYETHWDDQKGQAA